MHSAPCTTSPFVSIYFVSVLDTLVFTWGYNTLEDVNSYVFVSQKSPSKLFIKMCYFVYFLPTFFVPEEFPIVDLVLCTRGKCMITRWLRAFAFLPLSLDVVATSSLSPVRLLKHPAKARENGLER